MAKLRANCDAVLFSYINTIQCLTFKFVLTFKIAINMIIHLIFISYLNCTLMNQKIFKQHLY